jgi:hypothetical protein
MTSVTAREQGKVFPLCWISNDSIIGMIPLILVSIGDRRGVTPDFLSL